ncbi:SapC family protein [Sphingomonas sp.]|uniref:SapC family protein n=1 Tax=Sphingomonas sp. TaxID=28214 RepID=UPI001DB0A6DC|nr:SapC family protein [Sphingomonas sp.]MBX9796283.1 SapC family protein [Sphingomonas sp.]
MATAPQLPLFYKTLEPLSSQLHADFKTKAMDRAPFLIGQHAIPLTVDEFPQVQRFMPIVFSSGDDAIPIALMGLNEGVNVFIDGEGKLTEQTLYIPAYIRRYPFMLARLTPEAQELSLCFDSSYEAVGNFEEGEPLFNGTEPSELTKNILQFNELFEQAGLRTQQFMTELRELDILIEGEVTIQPDGAAQPFIYRGFQMVDEKKLTDLRGDQLRKMSQNGMLPLIYAHMFSLALMREIFQRQVDKGLMPQPELVLGNPA